MPKFRILPFFLLAAISLSTISCKKNSAIGTDISFISVCNATTNVTGLSFLVNGESIGASSLPIGEKTVYYGVYQGLWSTEAIPGNGSAASLKRDLTFTAGEHNSLFVTGKADSLDYFIIKDEANIKDPNTVKIKFLNLSPDAGTLNLEVALLGKVTRFSGMAYKLYSDYQNFNAGTIYTLTLKDNATNNIIGTPITKEFVQGKVYTVWAKGSLNATVEAGKVGIQISEVN